MNSDFDEEVDLLEDEFTRATKFIERSHDQFEQRDLLKFYGFYKQATVGRCDIPKPGIFSMTARAKWSAWNELGTLPKEEAMKEYIKQLTNLQPNWDQCQGDDELKPQKAASWVSVSTFAQEEEQLGSEDESIVDFIKQGDLEKLKTALGSSEITSVINQLDEDGLGLVHWAADRGNVTILEQVLAVSGIDLNLRDSGGQTALHYASSCGNRDCVKLLVDLGADRDIRDDEGESCMDVAFDSGIKELLFD